MKHFDKSEYLEQDEFLNTLKEYEEVKGFAKIAKSSFEDYTNPCKQPYNDSAYNGMVEVFKKL